VAIAAGFISVSLIMFGLNDRLNFIKESGDIGLGQMVAVLGGAALAVGIGLLDDVLNLRARWQLLGQIGLAGVAVFFGATALRINFPLTSDGTLPLGAFAGAATMIWIVGTMNSINFIDGLDGLSSGIGLIAAVTLGLICLSPATYDPPIALLSFILAGALAGFLRWNFNPASIFPGTSGVMLVGYLLAVLSVISVAKTAVALLVLGVPILDAFWIIVRRVAAGRSPFAADRGHIHHRLLDMGLSHRASVLTIYGVSILLAILSLVLSGTGSTWAFVGLAVAFGLILLVIEHLAETADEEKGR
jgi:UDP-GlcNAc:undecaprenyl-phosphate GlcNAc-1-phosphate transferase